MRVVFGRRRVRWWCVEFAFRKAGRAHGLEDRVVNVRSSTCALFHLSITVYSIPRIIYKARIRGFLLDRELGEDGGPKLVCIKKGKLPCLDWTCDIIVLVSFHCFMFGQCSGITPFHTPAR
jgi:hypothetical protein